jgi:hypothetical protein
MGKHLPAYASEQRHLLIRSGRHELIATSDVITIDGADFRLDAVDRVGYHVLSQMHVTSHVISLGEGRQQRQFMSDVYGDRTQLDDARRYWNAVVDLLEHKTTARLADEAVRSVLSGQTVRFGTSIVAELGGLRRRRPFATTLPWDRMLLADITAEKVRVWSDDTPDRKRPKMWTAAGGWNAVLLPRVIAIMKHR